MKNGSGGCVGLRQDSVKISTNHNTTSPFQPEVASRDEIALLADSHLLCQLTLILDLPKSPVTGVQAPQLRHQRLRYSQVAFSAFRPRVRIGASRIVHPTCSCAVPQLSLHIITTSRSAGYDSPYTQSGPHQNIRILNSLHIRMLQGPSNHFEVFLHHSPCNLTFITHLTPQTLHICTLCIYCI